MEEDFCVRCSRTGEQVKLVDAIYGREVEKICEECAMGENVPLIRRPSSEQLKESEKPYSIKQRLNKMAGIDLRKDEKKDFARGISLDKLRPAKDYKSILDRRYEATKKRNQPLNLISNFNWHILMARKDKKITRKQLADVIGESESTIRLVEENYLPDDAARVINKIEQYFGMNLRIGGKLQHSNQQNPAVVLKFDPEIAKNITIDDLKRMKEEREKMGSDVVVDFTQDNIEEAPKESGFKKFFKGLFKSKPEENPENPEISENPENSKL